MPRPAVGDESIVVINPGASDDTVYGYVRSGKVNIRVRIEGGTGDDPSGAQATMTATLKRLQQLQDNKAATVTAPDEQVTATNWPARRGRGCFHGCARSRETPS
ncbi:hypothetical protein ACWGQ9_23565 [Streptomyces parvus]